MAEPEIPLAVAIRGLREQLLEAMAEGQDDEIRFALGPVELELELTLARESGVEGGLALWMVTLGGKAGRSTETAHRMKLTLTPVQIGADGAVRKNVIVGSELDQRPAG